MTSNSIGTAGKGPGADGFAPSDPIELNDEDRSKDGFFVQLAGVAEAMIAEHGKDFAMGALVLTARFIAEGKPHTKGAASLDPAQRPVSGPS
ncbi:MAG: hypothetical protein QM576_24335 [Rhodopseudomonas sp.]|uniref:hypothetical protein n=1 Tax=Rhodopseudomonas sp. TaxID=1078 RepID=UPI0039E586D3